MILRIYLMGYEPPGLDMDAVGEEWIEERIAECDMCFTVTNGCVPPVGGILESVYDMKGVGDSLVPVPSEKRFYRVLGQEHFGKVLVVEEV